MLGDTSFGSQSDSFSHCQSPFLSRKKSRTVAFSDDIFDDPVNFNSNFTGTPCISSERKGISEADTILNGVKSLLVTETNSLNPINSADEEENSLDNKRQLFPNSQESNDNFAVPGNFPVFSSTGTMEQDSQTENHNIPSIKNIRRRSDGQRIRSTRLHQSTPDDVHDDQITQLTVPETNLNPYASQLIHDSSSPSIPLSNSSFNDDQSRKQSKRHVFVVRGQSASRFVMDYDCINRLGGGHYSEVFLARHKLDGCLYAIKQLSKPCVSIAELGFVTREVYALSALVDCAYAVHYFSSWIDNGRLYIQLEYCRGQDLETRYIRKAKELVWRGNRAQKRKLDCSGMESQEFDVSTVERLVMSNFWSICFCVSSALSYMLSKGIVHLDIRPANIFCCSAKKYKLGDFGNSCSVNESKCIPQGEDRYLSREALSADAIMSSSSSSSGRALDLRMIDIFALGASLYELSLGEALPNHGSEWKKIRSGVLCDVSLLNATAEEELSLSDFLKNLMNCDSTARPDANTICEIASARMSHA